MDLLNKQDTIKCLHWVIEENFDAIIRKTGVSVFDYEAGLCFNLLDYSEHGGHLLDCCQNWEYYSGRYHYPIPADKNVNWQTAPDTAFDEAVEIYEKPGPGKWKGEQLELRKDLCAYFINILEEKDD